MASDGEVIEMGWEDGEIWPVDDPTDRVAFTIDGDTLTMEQDGEGFVMDTRSFREVLGPDIPLSEPQVVNYIKDYIKENMEACRINF